VGQRALSAVVDVAFFISITLLGLHEVLKESSLILVLSIYATGRFSVAQSKQQQQGIAQLMSGGNYPPSGGGGLGGGGGGSGTMRIPPEVKSTTASSPTSRTPRRDDRVEYRDGADGIDYREVVDYREAVHAVIGRPTARMHAWMNHVPRISIATILALVALVVITSCGMR
jgi:hypothetical protein